MTWSDEEKYPLPSRTDAEHAEGFVDKATTAHSRAVARELVRLKEEVNATDHAMCVFVQAEQQIVEMCKRAGVITDDCGNNAVTCVAALAERPAHLEREYVADLQRVLDRECTPNQDGSYDNAWHVRCCELVRGLNERDQLRSLAQGVVYHFRFFAADPLQRSLGFLLRQVEAMERALAEVKT